MRALLLASGFGTRLGPLTKETPKPLIPVAGRPCIEHILFHLSKFGINDVMVTVHYKYDKIMEYLGDRVTYLYEPTLEGEQKAIEKASKWFVGNYMLVQNADTITDLDINFLYLGANGKSTRFMDWKDPKIYAGVKILSPTYLMKENLDTIDSSVDAVWHDIGTPEGLSRANEYYGKR